MMLPDTGNLSPEDPRVQYSEYLRTGGFSLPDDPPRRPGNANDRDRGWREYGMGVIRSLRHDPDLLPVAGDPYLPRRLSTDLHKGSAS